MNEITLDTTSSPPFNKSVGDTNFTLLAGETLKIETSPDGDDILDIEVPAGKAWDVSIFVKIICTDC